MLRSAAVCLALGLPTQAVATSCATGMLYAWPVNGAEDVPTNVVVRVAYASAHPRFDPVVLEDDSGRVVETTLTQVSGDEASTTVWTLEPVKALDRLSTYRVRAGKDAQRPSFVSTFTTGSSADRVRPRAPAVLEVDLGRARSKEMDQYPPGVQPRLVLPHHLDRAAQ